LRGVSTMERRGTKKKGGQSPESTRTKTHGGVKTKTVGGFNAHNFPKKHEGLIGAENEGGPGCQSKGF